MTGPEAIRKGMEGCGAVWDWQALPAECRMNLIYDLRHALHEAERAVEEYTENCRGGSIFEETLEFHARKINAFKAAIKLLEVHCP